MILFTENFQADAENFYEITDKLNRENRENPLTDELNKTWIKLFAKTCRGNLCPMQAVIGGIAAQEVMKVSQTVVLFECKTIKKRCSTCVCF